MTFPNAQPVALAAALLAAASLASAAPVNLRPVAEGLDRPVVVAHAGDGSGRLFIAQQGGEILVFDGTRLLPGPFLGWHAPHGRELDGPHDPPQPRIPAPSPHPTP